MVHSETEPDQLKQLTFIMNHAVSMELRVDNADVGTTVHLMEGMGFQRRNIWASVHLPNHSVIDFWRKELTR
jgi:hypothetical protein